MIGHLVCAPGVKFDRIAPAGARIIGALDAYARFVGKRLVVTCGTEGHGPTDPHTTGDAYDLSVQGWSDEDILDGHRWFCDELPGMWFTTLYEVRETPTGLLLGIAFVNPEATGPHFHLQRKKGTVYPPG